MPRHTCIKRSLLTFAFLSFGIINALAAGQNQLVSVNVPNSLTGNRVAFESPVSDDGRYVAFQSSSSNLVTNDTNGTLGDVYRYDASTDSVALVSVNLAGTGSGNGSSFYARMSGDGRYVLFVSFATDLVATPDANGLIDLFVRDMQTGTTQLVSVNAAGTGASSVDNELESAPSITPDGRYVVFDSSAGDLAANDTNGVKDLFRRDLQTGTTSLVSVNAAGTASGNGASSDPYITPDGRYVVFESAASDLVGGDGNGVNDVLRRDFQTGTTTLVSVDSSGAAGSNGRSYAPEVSDNGQFVAYASLASNLVANDTNGAGSDVFRRDLAANATALVSVNAAGTGSGNNLDPALVQNPRLSADGNRVVFESDADDLVTPDTNGTLDVFLRDVSAGTTASVSRNSAGTDSGDAESSNQRITPDGSYVVFETNAGDIDANDLNGIGNDALLYNVGSGARSAISENLAATGTGNGLSGNPVISPNGLFVGFVSYASDLVAPGDTNGSIDIFLRNVGAGTTALASKSVTPTAGGVSGLSASSLPSISADGQLVAFTSFAGNLVPNDTNAANDVFVYNRLTGAMTLVSVNLSGVTSSLRSSTNALISANGRVVVFVSNAPDLVAGDTNNSLDIFARDLLTGTTTMVTRNSAGTNGGNGIHFSAFISVSADGRYVSFLSTSSNLALDANSTQDVFVRDLQTGTTSLVSVNSAGTGGGNTASVNPRLSADGRYVVFNTASNNITASDTNVFQDVFVRDLVAGTTSLVSVNSAGTASGNGNSQSPVVSADGRYVAFLSGANNLVASGDTNAFQDVFVRDTVLGTTAMVSVNSAGTNGSNANPAPTLVISANGRVVTFATTATDISPSDTNPNVDIYARDLIAGTTSLVSINSAGTNGGNGASQFSSLSADGRFVAFRSDASDLAAGDGNGATDVFLRDLQAGTTELVSHNLAETASGNGQSAGQTISADGRYVAFDSSAGDLAANDTNGATRDVFIARVVPSADLSITKTATKNPANVNQIFGYNLTVHNDGPDDATAVVVTDTLPVGPSFQSAQPSQGTCLFASGVVTCQMGTLADGVTATVFIRVKPRQAGTLVNTASVSAAEDDPDTADNTVMLTTSAVSNADLSVGKTDSADPVLVGAQVTYTVTVTNNGLSPATGVTLTDTLPSAMTFVSASPSQGSITSSPPVGSSGTVVAGLGNLAVGAIATVTITVTATQAGVFTNSATATGNEADTNTANNTKRQATTVVTLQKILMSASTVVGGCQPYPTGTIYLTGPAPAGGVTVTMSSTNAGATPPPTVFIAAGALKSDPFAVPTSTAATPQGGSVKATLGAKTAGRSLTVNPGACGP